MTCETFKFWDLVWLIFEVWWYMLNYVNSLGPDNDNQSSLAQVIAWHQATDKQQAITWTSDDLLPTLNPSVKFNKGNNFQWKKLYLKMSAAKQWPFCSVHSVLTHLNIHHSSFTQWGLDVAFSPQETEKLRHPHRLLISWRRKEPGH